MINYKYKNIKILKVDGIDNRKFLQGLITTDLNKISLENDILFTAFTNLKGRIISLCFIKYINENEMLLSVDESIVNDLILWLKKYGMFSKVNFSINNEYSLFYTDEGFLNHNILLTGSLQNNVSFEEVQKQNMFNKLTFINTDNSEKFLPNELELNSFKDVICYTKGCYMGQEVIARIHYKARIKKELAVVKSNNNIISINLKDKNNKPLADVVNKIFVGNMCYMLVVFYKKAMQDNYQLDDGKVITKC